MELRFTVRVIQLQEKERQTDRGSEEKTEKGERGGRREREKERERVGWGREGGQADKQTDRLFVHFVSEFYCLELSIDIVIISITYGIKAFTDGCGKQKHRHKMVRERKKHREIQKERLTDRE